MAFAPMPEPLREAVLPSLQQLCQENSVPFNSHLWLGKQGLAGDPAVEHLCNRFPSQELTRDQVVEVARDAVASPEALFAARRLVVATYMWGYGTQGRAYLNAPRALAEDQDRLNASVLGASRALLQRDIIAAYDAFRNPRHPKGYNWGFFTKYLYFFGLACGWPEERPMPLIWDSRVDDTLTTYQSVFGWAPEWPRGKAQRYEYFCGSVHAWSRQLGVRSDQIELFLFKSRHANATHEALEVAASAIRLLNGIGSSEGRSVAERGLTTTQ